MMKVRRFIASLPPWTLTCVVSAAILYLTLVPRPLPDTDIQLFEGADKVVHAIMFGGLAGAIALDMSRRRSPGVLTTRRLTLCWVIATMAGGAIELTQDAMQMGRGCELWDFVADAAGALLAVMVAKPVARFVQYRENT